jgi:hypothetical protein
VRESICTQEPAVDAGSLEAVMAESSFACLLRRFVIRHSHKAVVVAAALLVVLTPSALGLSILVGTEASMLLLGGARGHKRATLRSVVVAACGASVAAWALAEYAVCNEWVAATTHGLGGDRARHVLRLVGLQPVQARSRSDGVVAKS